MDCHSDIVGDCKDDNVKQKNRIKPYTPPLSKNIHVTRPAWLVSLMSPYLTYL